MRAAIVEHEGPVRELGEGRLVQATLLRVRIHPLGVQPRVDRVRPGDTGVQLAPELPEADVVLAPAERARSVTGPDRSEEKPQRAA